MKLCDYCENEATSTWDFTTRKGVRIPIAACGEHFDRAKLQQETVASRDAFHEMLNAEAEKRGWIASHGI